MSNLTMSKCIPSYFIISKLLSNKINSYFFTKNVKLFLYTIHINYEL